MTIEQAENQYRLEVASRRKQFARRAKLTIVILNITSIILVIGGYILIRIAENTPPEINIFGMEEEGLAASFERLFGKIMLILGPVFFLGTNLIGCIALKKGPRNFLPQIKNLYYNYLKCVDMDNYEKEFYKQKLEDIRNIELINAMHQSANVASSAIMFSSLRK